MKQDRSLPLALSKHWLSWLLLVMAYATYGNFLHNRESTPVVWGVSLFLALWGSWAITLGWPQMRRLLLMGFQSDLGYFVMALTIASLSVAAVTQFQQFAYLVMLLAVSLLVRVDKLIAGYNDSLAFILLSLLSLFGMALSWIPRLVAAFPAGGVAG
jgi:hypothetical protein